MNMVASTTARDAGETTQAAARGETTEQQQQQRRRRRLHQILERETSMVERAAKPTTPIPRVGCSTLRGVKSLPSLELLECSAATASTGRKKRDTPPQLIRPCPASPVLTKRGLQLSPLRSHRERRPQTRQATARASSTTTTAQRTFRGDGEQLATVPVHETDKDHRRPHTEVVEEERGRVDEKAVEKDEEGIKTIHAKPPTQAQHLVQDQIAKEAAISRQADDWEKQRTRMINKAYKAAQLDQIHAKQLRRTEKKLDTIQLAEQMQWEQTQLELIDQSRRASSKTNQSILKQARQQTLEMDRRRGSALKISQHFFDRLAVLEPSQAMALFLEKRHELVACCLDLMDDISESKELEAFQEAMRESLEREELLLRHRVRAAQREVQNQMEKKRFTVALKQTQYDEIQRHLRVTREGKKTERALRNEIVKQQEIQDQRVGAQRRAKKQKDIELSLNLEDQMRRHRAEQATVSLRIQGTTSPVLWTPYWSDGSVDAQAASFQRLEVGSRAATAASPERPTIFAKKTHRWYD